MALKKPGDLRIPPQATDAEMAVLGSMLIEREAIETACETVDETHFYSRANRIIFAAIKRIYDRQGAVDLVTISEELKSSGQLSESGGEGYLSELIGKVSTAAHVQHYAELVRQKALLRDLINSATTIVESCYETDEEPDKLVDSAEDKIFAIAQKRALQGFMSADKIADDVTRNLEEAMKNRNAITGVPSGFYRFDEMTGGLQKADLIILAARPSQGKTAMALNMAYHAAVDKSIPTAVFSLEMSRNSLFERMVCSAAMTDVKNTRTGMLKRDRWAALTSEIDRIRRAPIWIDDSSGLNITEIRMRAKRLASELKRKNLTLGLIVIDYLQLIQGGGKRSENRQQEVSEISRRLKELARTLNIPVMALSQLNRRAEDKDRGGNRPQLSDLRDSGSLEQDADVVALIHREEYYRRDDPAVKGLATLIIAKQRNGPTGDVDLNFLSQFTKFTNPAPRSIEGAPEAVILPS